MKTSTSANSWNYIKSTASESSDCQRRTNIMLICREYMFRFLRVYCCLCTRVLGRGMNVAKAPRPIDVLPQRIPSTDKSRYTKRPARAVCVLKTFSYAVAMKLASQHTKLNKARRLHNIRDIVRCRSPPPPSSPHNELCIVSTAYI